MQIRRLNSLIDQNVGEFHNENGTLFLSNFHGMSKLIEVTPELKINILSRKYSKDKSKLRWVINQLNNLKIKRILSEIMEGNDEVEETIERFYVNKDYYLVKFTIPKSEDGCAKWDLSGKLLPATNAVYFQSGTEAIQDMIKKVERSLELTISYISKLKDDLNTQEKNKVANEKVLAKLKNNFFANYEL